MLTRVSVTSCMLVFAIGCSVEQAEMNDESATETEGTPAGSSAASHDGGDDDGAGTVGSSGPNDTTSGTTTTGEGEDSSEDSGDLTTGGGDSLPSSACRGSSLAPGAHAAVPLAHGGLDRSYDLFVPPAHDGETPLPLVVNLHGWTVTPAGQAAFSQMNVTAADRGFSVAYPAGFEESWNGTLCCGGAHSSGLDDVGFVRAVVDDLDDTLCFDRRRIYAAGHSNGAFLTHMLACDAADLFAAVGAVAGTLPVGPEACTPSRPIPVAHLHGTGDPIVAYEGGGFIGHPSAADSAAGWAARNGCDAQSEVALQSDDVTCHAWTGCSDDAEVRLCAFAGMGHCWPGNPDCDQGTASTTLHGSEMLADFFEAHAMP